MIGQLAIGASERWFCFCFFGFRRATGKSANLTLL